MNPGADDGCLHPTPDEAFATLADETRIAILRALGAADGPMSFSDLRRAVDVDDPGRFNYHLDRLRGTFIRRSDEGYLLRHAGRRIVSAVQSGVATEAPTLEPTRIDTACSFCGADIEIAYRHEMVETYCTDCSGLYRDKDRESVDSTDGHLGGLPLPPVGIEGRTPEEIYGAAVTWGFLDFISLPSSVCPRCSAELDHAVTICEDHDTVDGICNACERRHAAQLVTRCSNCIFVYDGMFVSGILGTTPVLSFLADAGINPLLSTSNPFADLTVEESIVSTDPFEVHISLATEDERLTVTVDADLGVIDAERESA